MNQALVVAIALMLMILLTGAAGCTSLSTAPSPTTSALESLKRPVNGTTALQAGPRPTKMTARIATKLHVWAPSASNPLWLSALTVNPVTQGSTVAVQYAVNGADGKHPCGVANYYIDNYAAGGVQSVTKPKPGLDGCPAGVSGGSGELLLNPADTAKLSPGWHTLKIDYLGDRTYAPAEFTAAFLVSARAPTPLATKFPTPTPITSSKSAPGDAHALS